MRDGNNTLGIPRLDVFESQEQIFQIDTPQLLLVMIIKLFLKPILLDKLIKKIINK